MTRLTQTRRHGSSMVELLVVIVIFLIGILAVVQIFPGGFSVLRQTRSNTVATQLIRAEMERLKGRSETMAEMIVPVVFTAGGGKINLVADPNRGPNNFGPAGVQLLQDGTIINTDGDNIGPWQYVSNANVMRRVIGEGGPIPAPKRVGNYFGGLLSLQFAPLVYSSDPLYQGLLVVYGNDMNRRDFEFTFGPPRPWEFYVEDAETSSATIYLPQTQVNPTQYLVSMTAWVDNGTTVERREIVDIPVTVTPGNNSFALGSFVVGNFVGADYDSIRCVRRFVEVPAFTGDPFEFILLDDTLGQILISPNAHNFRLPASNGRRVPLTARVNYDVYDWRIIRDEFRVPAGYPARQKLKIGSLFVFERNQPDGKPWKGMNVFVPPGNNTQRDFLIVDMDSGGIFNRDGYDIDATIGLITFRDMDNDPSNGLQQDVILPGSVAATRINAYGRQVRAMYQVVGEWSVQVSKAAATYRGALGRPGLAQFYAGGSGAYFQGPGIAGEQPSRIYFPPMDDGKLVTVGEIWYGVAGQEPRVLADQEFLIRSTPADPTGLPYIDIADKLGSAEPLNYVRYGYAVKSVKGGSVNVRAMWNPASFKLTDDPDENMLVFEKWIQNLRHSSTTTYLVKEEK